MHGGCDPRTFYNVHRPLLSGWRDNPDLPDGLVYEVSRYEFKCTLTLSIHCIVRTLHIVMTTL